MSTTLHYHTFQLPLRHTFTIAHGSRTHQPTLIVVLGADGLYGYGEATATSYYGLTLQGMVDTLERVRPLVEALDLHEPDGLWKALSGPLANDPFVLCALDVAAHDLVARRRGLPLHALWGLPRPSIPVSNYTIGMAPVEEMVAKMQAFPWPIYKIKLGSDDDLALVRELRRHTDAVFRVDANTGWTVEETLAYALVLAELGVEFIEQPLKADDWEGMAYLYRHCPLPLMADESCQRHGDVAMCHDHFHGVNVKLMKCGGLTPAVVMLRQARALGMKTMVGCMTESSVGISAIAHLLPLLDYVDMDGALLLAEDPATGVQVTAQGVVLAEGTGTGAGMSNQGLP